LCWISEIDLPASAFEACARESWIVAR